MRKTLLIFLIIASSIMMLAGCSSGEIEKLKGENSALSSKVQILEKELAELKNSPQIRYSKAVELEKSNKFDEALKEYESIHSMFPTNSEAKTALAGIERINKIKQEEKEKEEARKREYEESIKPPLQLLEAEVTLNAISNPQVQLIVKNISKKTVDAYTVGIYCFDRYGKNVNHYAHGNNRHGGLSQETIYPGKTNGYNSYWTLHGRENTSKIKVILEKVHMTDGTTWTPTSGQEIAVEGVLDR